MSYLHRLDQDPNPFLLRSWLALAFFQELGIVCEEVLS